MYWVIQSNVYNEEGFGALISTLERLGLQHSIHKVVPFVGTLETEPDVPSDGKAIVLGTYSLARHARARGWVPGAFLENLDFVAQRERWGDRMLNADALVCPFAEVPFQELPFFLRPVHDTKAFTGLVLDWGQYTAWRDTLIRLPETNDPVNDPLGISLLTVASPMMVCSKKEVYSETRTWVIDGRVVTASGYKIGTIKRYSPPSDVDPRIIEFAEECVDIWAPNRAFVLDVADTPNGLRIVEINNLNSAGFYKADMNRLVMAIEDMPF